MSRDEHPESELTRRAREAMAGLSADDQCVIALAVAGGSVAGVTSHRTEVCERLASIGVLVSAPRITTSRWRLADLGREVARLLSQETEVGRA